MGNEKGFIVCHSHISPQMIKLRFPFKNRCSVSRNLVDSVKFFHCALPAFLNNRQCCFGGAGNKRIQLVNLVRKKGFQYKIRWLNALWRPSDPYSNAVEWRPCQAFHDRHRAPMASSATLLPNAYATKR